jgi:aspartate aminotransferase
MNAIISTWGQNALPSPTLAIDAKAKALKAAGHDICSLGTGEPDFDTPEFIKAACIKALQEGKTKYIASAGLPELRQAVAQDYTLRHKAPSAIEASQVIISPGGKFSCHLSILATCSPGDEVLIPSPYWVSYPEMVKLAGAKPIVVPSDSSFKVSPEILQPYLSPKTRLLIINSPSNPSGVVYSKGDIEALVEWALKHNIYILSDEIYEHLTYDNATHTSPAALSKDAAAITLVASGFSKSFSMTGWRLGTLIVPPHLAKVVDNLQVNMTSNATTFAQYGALEALQNTAEAQKFLNHMVGLFDKRRMHLYQGLQKMPKLNCKLSQGAFYLFPDISAYGLASATFAQEALEKYQLAVVPGSAFGYEGYIRLSYATNENVLDEALIRLESFCKSL